jgi:hypothetical protein
VRPRATRPANLIYLAPWSLVLVFKTRIAQMGFDPLPGPPQRMVDLIKSDTARYREVARMIKH